MRIDPPALKASDARLCIGATERAWREIVREGRILPLPWGAFAVTDLNALVERCRAKEAPPKPEIRSNSRRMKVGNDEDYYMLYPEMRPRPYDDPSRKRKP